MLQMTPSIQCEQQSADLPSVRRPENGKDSNDY